MICGDVDLSAVTVITPQLTEQPGPEGTQDEQKQDAAVLLLPVTMLPALLFCHRKVLEDLRAGHAFAVNSGERGEAWRLVGEIRSAEAALAFPKERADARR